MTFPTNRPLIGITMGDPLGIGPEILMKVLNDPDIHAICRPFVIGDEQILAKARYMLSLDMDIHQPVQPELGRFEYGTLNLMATSRLDPEITCLESPSPEIGRAMEDYILTGVDLAMDRRISALVTCPITKTGLARAGSEFHGHTELLAARTGTREFAMMLAGDRLKVVLVTIHIPLADVPACLTRQNIDQTIRLTHDALVNRFGFRSPRLAVAGLNPHAGEETLFGREEADTIQPAVRTARNQGMNIQGPLPPDTVFYHALNGKFDAVICMYHDQGLIPFKLVHFEDGVNTTLGLPIIRTSVDHGTAYDIAWKGKADPSSLEQAIRMAVLQANQRTDG